MTGLGACATECDSVSTARIRASSVAPNPRVASNQGGGLDAPCWHEPRPHSRSHIPWRRLLGRDQPHTIGDMTPMILLRIAPWERQQDPPSTLAHHHGYLDELHTQGTGLCVLQLRPYGCDARLLKEKIGHGGGHDTKTVGYAAAAARQAKCEIRLEFLDVTFGGAAYGATIPRAYGGGETFVTTKRS